MLPIVRKTIGNNIAKQLIQARIDLKYVIFSKPCELTEIFYMLTLGFKLGTIVFEFK